MCGIIAYSGHQPATPILMDGLHRMEYRGYDSSGIAFIQKHQINVIKASGKLIALENKLASFEMPLLATAGIGHTRWATHGAPTENNAHPHLSNNGKFALAHNGIIENYQEIKNHLQAAGFKFYSDTDTEVLVNLIEYKRRTAPDNLTAFRDAVKEAEGAYALALVVADEPDTIYATHKSAPLIVGLGVGENFIASDITAFLPYTRKVVFLDEDAIVQMNASSCNIFDIELKPLPHETQTIEWDIQSAQKGGFKHFMLKEIFEQPTVLRSALAGRADLEHAQVKLPELEGLERPERIRIVACGTSFNAGCWAIPLLEQWGGIPTSVEIASEFRYRKPILSKGELIILISQSGETADTLGALKVARESGAKILGLCNVIGASIARESDRVIYTQAGPEISVASTKALCSQMAVLSLLALYWGSESGRLSAEDVRRELKGFYDIADLLEKELPAMCQNIKPVAVMAAQAKNIFFLGRGQSWPMAMEGSLKFKELSYVHAEAYAAGEMKHGPIALIDPDFLTIALAPRDEHYAKTLSNVGEVAARSGPIIIFTQGETEKDNQTCALSCSLPEVPQPFASFLLLPMLQLLSYEAANYLGKDVDQPRNLAKSVTVE